MEEKSRALRDAEENVDHVCKNILAKTKSRISNHRNNSCYIATNAVQAITDQLEQNNIAIVAGCPGSGKTTTILEVMTNLSNKPNESFTPAIIGNPGHWDRVVNSSERMIIYLDDPMGKSNFDILNFVKWEKQFENMISCSNYGKCFIVIAIRDHVLEEMNKVCRPNNLFTKQNTMSVSKGKFKLDENEKMKMLMKYQITNNRELSDKDKCVILKSQPYYGFPQTCFLFFTNDSLFELGVSFFTRPDKTLVNEIEKLRKSDSRAKNLQYYVLVYVLINKTINMQSSETCVVTEINRLANLTKVELIEIKDRIEELDDVYLILSEGSNEEFMFRHETIKEAVLISYFRVNPKLIIKNCSLSDLGELIRTDTYRTKDQEVVLKVAISEYQDIIDRYMGFDSSYVELLQCCVFNEWLGILEILFEKDDTLVNQTDEYGMTLITYAALWKKKKLVKYLYDNKANVKLVNKFGSCLHFCVLNDWTDLLDILFTNDRTLIDQRNANGVSLIEYAAKNNKTDIVMYLYKMNANIQNKSQICKFLKYCVDNKWHDVLSLILKKDRTLINVKVTQTHSLITYAASQNNLDIVKQLLDHIKKETEFSDPFSLLKICVDNEWFDLLDTLFKDWSNILNKKNKDGISLICYAAQWEDKKHMVEFLMQHGADYNSISILENCVENEWTDIIDNMINETPSLLNVNMADDGFTLICYAASQRSISIIDLLLDHNADIHNSLFLNVCVDNKLTDVIERVITKQPDLVNCTNPSGDTLICYAAKQMQSEIVLLLIDRGAQIEQDDLTRRNFIQLCVDNKWENVLDKLFQMYPSVVDINRASFGSALFAYDAPEQIVIFLYAYIPRGSLSSFYIHRLFQNFVLKRRFRALELFMRDYPDCSSLENAFYYFDRNAFSKTGQYKQPIVLDDDVYKIMCIDQSLVDDKTASPTFRYCLEKRPQVILLYTESHQNVYNIHLDGNSLILHSAFHSQIEIVSRLIYPWASDIYTSNDDRIKLFRYCIDNNWDTFMQQIMEIEHRHLFLEDNALAMLIYAADKGSRDIVNLIVDVMKNTDLDSIFNLLKKVEDIRDFRLIYDLLPHDDSEFIYNSKNESLLTYVASENNRQMTMGLVEALPYEDFLGTEIESLLQKYIENDWGDVLLIILSKIYKLVTNGMLGEINRYAIRKNNMESIVSVLECEIDHNMIHASNDNRIKLFRYCIDNEKDTIIHQMMEIEHRHLFLEDNALAILIYAADKGSRDIVNLIVDALKNTDLDSIFNLLKKVEDIRDFRLIYDLLPHDDSEYIYNSKGESLITYVASEKSKQMNMGLVEALPYEDFLGTEIESLLQKYIENDWGDILRIILSKIYKLVTNCMLGEINRYAIRKNNMELIVSVLEYEIGHKMIHASNDNRIKLFRYCIDNEKDTIIQQMMEIEDRHLFLEDNALAMLMYAANKGSRDIVNLIVDALKNTDIDSIFNLLKKVEDIRDFRLIYDLLPHDDSEFIYNSKNESLLTYVASENNRQMTMCLVEALQYEDFLGTEIESLLQNYIENDWGDILRIILSKIYKLVTNGMLGEINRYAIRKNNKELIVSLLEYEIDHIMIHASNDNRIKLFRYCIDNEWDTIIQQMMEIEHIHLFLEDNALAMMINAADKGFRNIVIVNLIVDALKNTDIDSIFNLLKKVEDIRDFRLIYALLPHDNSEYIYNSKGESLITYVASEKSKQMNMGLVEALPPEDFLGTEIEPLLQKYIENDWGDILRFFLSKTYKLVTNGILGEIVCYTTRNNKNELILSLLDYEIDNKMIGVIAKHCIDHEWCDGLQKVLLNEDKEIVNVLECDSLPVANYAARSCKSAIVEHMFLYNNVNVDHFDKYGYTPLHYCASKGWTYSVEMIIAKKSSLIVRTQNGVDCIHLAAFFGRFPLLKIFKGKGQKLTEKTSFGCNAFQMLLLGLRYVSNKSPDFPFRERCKSFCMDIYEKDVLTVKQFDSSVHNEYEELITYISLKPNFQAIDLHFPMDKYGNSILHYLVINDNQTLVNWVLAREDKLELVKNGTELPSVLHIAAYLGRSQLFQTFFGSDKGTTCGNNNLMDAFTAGRNFAGQAVHNSPSGWINEERIFVYDIKIKAVKYVEFQFGKDEEFDSIKESVLSRL